MKFWAAKNLTQLSVAPCVPWEFAPASFPTAQICKVKEDRQDWYQNPATEWQFYTGIEAVCDTQRVSDANPPLMIHAFVADVDMALTDTRLDEALQSYRIKPTYFERSLGGNCRVVWLLERPIPTHGDMDFARFILQKAFDWLGVSVALPGADVKAWESPTRLYANGGQWRATGANPVPWTESQVFFMKMGSEFKFSSSIQIQIPMSVVAQELKKKFPNFDWPTDFAEGSQGPSFWIPGSTSPQSAIVKSNGLFTFSAHADKGFYSWADLLGKEIVSAWEVNTLAKATAEVYFDGDKYWRLFDDPDGGPRYFDGEKKEDFVTYLTVKRGVSAKPDKDGISQLQRAMQHVRDCSRIDSAAPILFQPNGVIKHGGRRTLNTSQCVPIQPTTEVVEWGGNLKFIAELLESMFGKLSEKSTQLMAWLSWAKVAYEGAYHQRPQPGQNIFIGGDAGTGKTLLSREIFGRLMGGFADAQNYMAGGDNFGAEMFRVPVWCLDDECMIETEAMRQKFSAIFKKLAANQSFRYNEKYEKATQIPWMGRAIVTLNLDPTSTKILITPDASAEEKICYFRSYAKPGDVKFPPRDELVKKVLKYELPLFARFLLDFQIPEDRLGDSRYIIKAFHEPTLLEKAYQGSKSAPFKEIIVSFLMAWFAGHPEAKEYRASSTVLMKDLMAQPEMVDVLRSQRIESINRQLEMLQRENVIPCRTETSRFRIRTWIFNRIEPDDETHNCPAKAA